MGFAEENADVIGGSGGAYLTGEQKQDLMENGIVFPIIGVELRDNPFEDGEQYVITVVLDDEDDDGNEVEAEKLLTYTRGAVESRDKLCDRLAKWLDDASNDPPQAKLTKVGRSQILAILTDEELAELESGSKPKAKPATAKPKAKPAAAKRTTAKRTTAKK